MILIADLSNWQQHVNLQHLKAVGVDGLYHKATEGDLRTHGMVDRYFASRRALAEKIGLPFGAYHFARPEQSPEANAETFCNVVGELRPGDLRPALDLESGNPRETEHWARRFNAVVRHRLGVFPLFYSYSAYISAMRLTETIGDGLWLASYGRNDGRDYPFFVPKPWRGALLHQFTSVGSISGVPMKVDLSHGPALFVLRTP